MRIPLVETSSRPCGNPMLRVDPLTAYVATSPGGMDAAAIIAASTHRSSWPSRLSG
jgi:hypothetical protein